MTMSDSLGIQKMEIDYSGTVDKLLTECDNLNKDGHMNESITKLLNMEKLTRTACDMSSTSRILIKIMKICFENKSWDALNENLKALTKRRNQLKQAITNMIQEVCTYVDRIDNMDVKINLINTIREVTLGKLYVEIERARLTKILADIKEKQGNQKEALDILQDIQVETLGSMDKREKFEFILDQMRLCLINSDFIRMQIISKKISNKALIDPNFQDLKLRYYEQMIQLDQNEKSYFAICQHFRAIYDVPEIENNEKEALNECLKLSKDCYIFGSYAVKFFTNIFYKAVLANVVLYTILSPYSLEQVDMINRVYKEKRLEKIPIYKLLIKWFLTEEIIHHKDFCAKFEKEIRSTPGFRSVPPCFTTDPAIKGTTDRWNVDLKARINEHNIRVMSKYYQRINLSRMAHLLDMTVEETEEILRNLVVSKIINSKIDRLAGIVTFHQIKDQDPEEILNEWCQNNDSLMNLVNRANHIINKEFMMRKIKTTTSTAA